MHFPTDPIVRDVIFGCVFLLPLITVLWLWYDSSGRTGSSRWAWRVILTLIVLLTIPALVLGAANNNEQDLMDIFGWIAIGSGAVAILGVVGYGIWGRTPMIEYDDEPMVDFSSYAPPMPPAPAESADQMTLTAAEPAPVAAPAPTLSAPVTPPAPAKPAEPVGAYLFVKTGADQGQQFPVGNQVTIGRGAGCGITLADNKVSSEHGQLKRQGDSYVYLDLKSTNGSFLLIEGREERLRTGQALVDGDELRLGGTVLKFIRVQEGSRR
jgi:hypothetical protein